MDLVNKLKSAVSNVLPVGNPITNDHEILAHRASGGPGLLWKIYAGIKRTTKQVSLKCIPQKVTMSINALIMQFEWSSGCRLFHFSLCQFSSSRRSKLSDSPNMTESWFWNQWKKVSPSWPGWDTLRSFPFCTPWRNPSEKPWNLFNSSPCLNYDLRISQCLPSPFTEKVWHLPPNLCSQVWPMFLTNTIIFQTRCLLNSMATNCMTQK